MGNGLHILKLDKVWVIDIEHRSTLRYNEIRTTVIKQYSQTPEPDRPERIYVDAHGLGLQLAEDLACEKLPVSSFRVLSNYQCEVTKLSEKKQIETDHILQAQPAYCVLVPKEKYEYLLKNQYPADGKLGNE